VETPGQEGFDVGELAAAGKRPARTLGQAPTRQGGSNVAVISVPGDDAALKAHEAGGPRVIICVLGADGDLQGHERQRKASTDVGCLITETAVRVSLAAAAIALRRPEIAAEAL
jgi:hypothetical protein